MLAVGVGRGSKPICSVANPEFVHLVTEANVRLTIADIRKRSPILNDLEKQGRIKMVGGLYDMHTGKIEILD